MKRHRGWWKQLLGVCLAAGLGSAQAALPPAGPASEPAKLDEKCPLPTPSGVGRPAPGSAPNGGQQQQGTAPSNGAAQDNAAQAQPQSDNVTPAGSDTNADANPFASQAGAWDKGSQSCLTSAGTGLTSATATNGAINVTTFSTSPLFLPGLFTAAAAQSATPTDRLSLQTGYFDNIRSFRSQPRNIIGPNGLLTPVFDTPRSDFDLWVYIVTVEKTFWNGCASVYASVPFLDAMNNTPEIRVDGPGAVNTGVKFTVWSDEASGSALTAGFTASLPTARDQTFIVNVNTTGGPTIATEVDPTFLQPYLSAIWRGERLFVQNYAGIVFPTDDRVATLFNNEFTLGYRLYQDESGCARLRSATATLGGQCLISLDDGGATTLPSVNPQPTFAPSLPPPAVAVDSFGFSNQLFLTGGLHLGMGERTVLSLGGGVPVVGPRAYSFGATVGLTYSY